MKYNINLEYKNKFYTIFLIGYTSEGGFFVKDLINDSKNFLIIKMLIPGSKSRKVGTHMIPMEKGEYWRTSKSPKLTHHLDGLTQISGEGIVSGFYKFFSGHKGVSTQSMDLYKRNNDGGPVLGFHLKNLPLEVKSKIKNTIQISRGEQIIDFHEKPKDEEDYCFSLEFFYLPKDIPNEYLNLSKGTIKFQHPNYGIVPLKYIPAPKHAPGVIGIFTTIMSKGESDKQFSFSLNGGAGISLVNGEFEHISIVYPFNSEMTGDKKIKDLDFVGFNKVKVVLDDVLHKVKTFIK